MSLSSAFCTCSSPAGFVLASLGESTKIGRVLIRIWRRVSSGYEILSSSEIPRYPMKDDANIIITC